MRSKHPARDTSRIVLPPASYAQEQEKIHHRLPAAIRFIRERKLNELFGPDDGRVGIILQGGMYNGVIRALERLGLADIWGNTEVPLYVLNVTYPLVDDEVIDFCRDKDAVLVVEEGQPDYLEQALSKILRNAGIGAKLVGKGPFPMAGEYTAKVMSDGVAAFLRAHAPELLPDRVRAPNIPATADDEMLKELAKEVPVRPAGFCTGCPERPIFAAMKLVEKELGEHQVASDIGCHLFSILPPFNIGGTTMGYGLGPASNSAFNVAGRKRADRGDGRWRLLAQRPVQRHRQRRLQQARRRHPSSSTISIPPRPAARTSCRRGQATRPVAPTIRLKRPCAASASNGCGPSTAPTMSRRSATP